MRSGAGSLALAAMFAVGAPQAAELELRRITPAGQDVVAGQQITLSFDRDMVPLGRMERAAEEIPVSIEPPLPCEWRWLDPQVLACQLPREQALLPATRYGVHVRPEFEALDGARLSRGVDHVFVTERPAARFSSPVGWGSPTEPVVRIWFSQPVTAKSVAASLRFGSTEVAVEPALYDDDTPYYTPDGEARRSWVVTPARPLAADRNYALRVAPGLRSAFGAAPGVERRELVTVHSFPDFEWRGLSCVVDGKPVTLSPARLQRQAPPCDPLSPVALRFSAPVAEAALGRTLQVQPDPLAGRGGFDAWAAAAEFAPMATYNRGGADYAVNLPYPWRAATQYRIDLPSTLKDGFGRPLAEAVRIPLQTAHRRPALHLQHPQAVVESQQDAEIPLVVTNIDRLDIDYARLTTDGLEKSLAAHRVPDGPRDIAFAMPMGLRELLEGRAGVLRGELRTDPPTTPAGREAPRFFAQVTPWQLHIKLGHDNSLAWVTDLASGDPVAGAEVQIYAAREAGLAPALDSPPARALTDAHGLARLPGTRELDPRLEHLGWRPDAPLVARVIKGRDLALLPLDNDFQVDVYRASNYRVGHWQRPKYGHLRAWGTTAQGVYRAGDRIQYKLYVRDAAGDRLAAAPPEAYRLQVYDPLGAVVHEVEDARLDAFAAFAGAFKLPPQAAVGWYRFELRPAFDGNASLQPLRVLVSDFTPASYHLDASLAAAQAAPRQTVEARLSARLHGGGPYGQAPARITARIRPQPFAPASQPAWDFRFDSDLGEARDVIALPAAEGRTDVNGEFAAPLALPDGEIAYGRLAIEGSVRDDRGRSIAASASVPYVARDRLIGLRYRGWLLDAGKPASVEWLVVDPDGRPRADSPSYLKIERRQTKVVRVLGPGNAYLPQYTGAWVEVGVCKGRSKLQPQRCGFTPDQAGRYRITAMVRDTEDRLQRTRIELYARGPQFVVWDDRPDLSLELVPQQRDNRVGATARFLVKNPFPGAQALVSVERYGVLDAWVQTLDGNTPIVEVPIKPDYLPGAYVSVVVNSPRVKAPPAEGPDLGRPTFRMGYAELPVDDPDQRIDVAVAPALEKYRPGDPIRVTLSASARQGRAAPVQYAVAVLDNAVFDLIQDGEDYFDPYKGLLALDPLDLTNYSLLTRLIGRQKIEKKGADPGGDGGVALSLRSIERFVAYWNPALPADEDGRAAFEFAAPDNLTRWRVLALAATPEDRFGLGHAEVAVSKDVELRPAMPNRVLAGDRFSAGFSVLNRSERTLELRVRIVARGAAQGELEQTVRLAPYERSTVALPLNPDSPGELVFEASAGSGEQADALRHLVAVQPRRPTATVADYGLLSPGTIERPLQIPAPILGGEFSLRLSPSVIGDIDGAFEYLRDYPYACWEQRISKAVMAAQFQRLQPYLSIEWPAAADLVEHALENAAAFQTPEGGMAYWVPEARYADPYLSAYTLMAFAWLQDAGYRLPPRVLDRLLQYNQGLLKQDFGYGSLGARSGVRALVLAALRRFGRLEAQDLQRFAPQLPRMGLFGQSMMLDAAKGIDADTAAHARRLIEARGRDSAGRLWLQADTSDGGEWMLDSDTRSNCAALSALLASDGFDAEDGVKLMRGIAQARQQRTHWYNTQENLWCASATADYARHFESEPLALDVQAALGAEPLGTLHLDTRRAPAQVLTRAIAETPTPRAATLQLRTQGEGQAYFAAQLRYVEPDEAVGRHNAGFEIRRQYARREGEDWVVMTPPYSVRRGDLVRVTLEVSAPGTHHFVVVDDPVPGALEPVNTELATASREDAAAGDGSGAAFYHRELRFDAVRHYADRLPAGRYRLQWLGQAVAVGEFAVPPPKVEAMYDPDVFGTDVGARIEVKPD